MSTPHEDDVYCEGLEVGDASSLGSMLRMVGVAHKEARALLAAVPAAEDGGVVMAANRVIACATRLTSASGVGVADAGDQKNVPTEEKKKAESAFRVAVEKLRDVNTAVVGDVELFEKLEPTPEEKREMDAREKAIAETLGNPELRAAITNVADASAAWERQKAYVTATVVDAVEEAIQTKGGMDATDVAVVVRFLAPSVRTKAITDGAFRKANAAFRAHEKRLRAIGLKTGASSRGGRRNGGGGGAETEELDRLDQRLADARGKMAKIDAKLREEAQKKAVTEKKIGGLETPPGADHPLMQALKMARATIEQGRAERAKLAVEMQKMREERAARDVPAVTLRGKALHELELAKERREVLADVERELATESAKREEEVEAVRRKREDAEETMEGMEDIDTSPMALREQLVRLDRRLADARGEMQKIDVESWHEEQEDRASKTARMREERNALKKAAGEYAVIVAKWDALDILDAEIAAARVEEEKAASDVESGKTQSKAVDDGVGRNKEQGEQAAGKATDLRLEHEAALGALKKMEIEREESPAFAELQAAISALAAAKSEVEAARKAIETWKEDMKAVGKRIKIHERGEEKLREKLQKKKAELERAQHGTKEKIQLQIEAIQRDLDGVTAKIKEEEQQKVALDDAIRKSEDRARVAEVTGKEALTRRKRAETALAPVTLALESQKTLIRKLDKDLADATAEKEAARKAIAKAEATRPRIAKFVKEAGEELSRAKKKRREVQRARDGAAQALPAMEDAVRRAMAPLREVQRSVLDQLDAQLAEAESKMGAARAKAADAEGELAVINAQIKALTRRVREGGVVRGPENGAQKRAEAQLRGKRAQRERILAVVDKLDEYLWGKGHVDVLDDLVAYLWQGKDVPKEYAELVAIEKYLEGGGDIEHDREEVESEIGGLSIELQKLRETLSETEAGRAVEHELEEADDNAKSGKARVLALRRALVEKKEWRLALLQAYLEGRGGAPPEWIEDARARANQIKRETIENDRDRLVEGQESLQNEIDQLEHEVRLARPIPDGWDSTVVLDAMHANARANAFETVTSVSAIRGLFNAAVRALPESFDTDVGEESRLLDAFRLSRAAKADFVKHDGASIPTATTIYAGLGTDVEAAVAACELARTEWRRAAIDALQENASGSVVQSKFAMGELANSLVALQRAVGTAERHAKLFVAVVALASRMVCAFECATRARAGEHFEKEALDRDGLSAVAVAEARVAVDPAAHPLASVALGVAETIAAALERTQREKAGLGIERPDGKKLKRFKSRVETGGAVWGQVGEEKPPTDPVLASILRAYDEVEAMRARLSRAPLIFFDARGEAPKTLHEMSASLTAQWRACEKEARVLEKKPRNDAIIRAHDAVRMAIVAVAAVKETVRLHISRATLDAMLRNGPTGVALSIAAKNADAGQAVDALHLTLAAQHYADPTAVWGREGEKRVPQTTFGHWLTVASGATVTNMRYGPDDAVVAPYEAQRVWRAAALHSRYAEHRRKFGPEAPMPVPTPLFNHALRAELWTICGIDIPDEPKFKLNSNQQWVDAMPTLARKHGAAMDNLTRATVAGERLKWNKNKGVYVAEKGERIRRVEGVEWRLVREAIGASWNTLARVVIPGGAAVRVFADALDSKHNRYFRDPDSLTDPTWPNPTDGAMYPVANAIVDHNNRGRDAVDFDRPHALLTREGLLDRQGSQNKVGELENQLKTAQESAEKAKREYDAAFDEMERRGNAWKDAEKNRNDGIEAQGAPTHVRAANKQRDDANRAAWNKAVAEAKSLVDEFKKTFTGKKEGHLNAIAVVARLKAQLAREIARVRRGGSAADDAVFLAAVPRRGIAVELSQWGKVGTANDQRSTSEPLFYCKAILNSSSNTEAFSLRAVAVSVDAADDTVHDAKITCVPRAAGINRERWGAVYSHVQWVPNAGASVAVRVRSGGRRPEGEGFDVPESELPVDCGALGNVAIIWPMTDRPGELAWRGVRAVSEEVDSLGYSKGHSAVARLADAWTRPRGRPPRSYPTHSNDMFVRKELREEREAFVTPEGLFHQMMHVIDAVDPVAVGEEGTDQINLLTDVPAKKLPFEKKASDATATPATPAKKDGQTSVKVMGRPMFEDQFNPKRALDALAVVATFPPASKAHAMRVEWTALPRVPFQDGATREKTVAEWTGAGAARMRQLSAGNDSHMSYSVPEEIIPTAHDAERTMRVMLAVAPRIPAKVTPAPLAKGGEAPVPAPAPAPLAKGYGLFGARGAGRGFGPASPNAWGGGRGEGKPKAPEPGKGEEKKAYGPNHVGAWAMAGWSGAVPLSGSADYPKSRALDNFGRAWDEDEKPWERPTSVIDMATSGDMAPQMRMCLGMEPCVRFQAPPVTPLPGVSFIDATKGISSPVAHKTMGPGDGYMFVDEVTGEFRAMSGVSVVYCAGRSHDQRGDWVSDRDAHMFTALAQFAAIAHTVRGEKTLPKHTLVAIKALLNANDQLDCDHARALATLDAASKLMLECAGVATAAGVLLAAVVLNPKQTNGNAVLTPIVASLTEATKAWKAAGDEGTVIAALSMRPPEEEFWTDDSRREQTMNEIVGRVEAIAALFKRLAGVTVAMGNDARDLALQATNLLTTFYAEASVVWWLAKLKLESATWRVKRAPSAETPLAPAVAEFLSACDKFAAERMAHDKRAAKKSDVNDAYEAVAKLAPAAMAALAEMKAMGAGSARAWVTGTRRVGKIMDAIAEIYDRRAKLRERPCIPLEGIKHGSSKHVEVPPVKPEACFSPESFQLPIWHPEHRDNLQCVRLLTDKESSARTDMTRAEAQRLRTLLTVADAPIATVWRKRRKTTLHAMSVTATTSVHPWRQFRVVVEGVQMTFFADPYALKPLASQAEFDRMRGRATKYAGDKETGDALRGAGVEFSGRLEQAERRFNEESERLEAMDERKQKASEELSLWRDDAKVAISSLFAMSGAWDEAKAAYDEWDKPGATAVAFENDVMPLLEKAVKAAKHALARPESEIAPLRKKTPEGMEQSIGVAEALSRIDDAFRAVMAWVDGERRDRAEDEKIADVTDRVEEAETQKLFFDALMSLHGLAVSADDHQFAQEFLVVAKKVRNGDTPSVRAFDGVMRALEHLASDAASKAAKKVDGWRKAEVAKRVRRLEKAEDALEEALVPVVESYKTAESEKAFFATEVNVSKKQRRDINLATKRAAEAARTKFGFEALLSFLALAKLCVETPADATISAFALKVEAEARKVQTNPSGVFRVVVAASRFLAEGADNTAMLATLPPNIKDATEVAIAKVDGWRKNGGKLN